MLVVEREIARIVVGLPILMNGRAGPEAEAARGFASALEEATGRPVALLDERWTTQEARRSVQETGAKGRKTGKRGRGKAAVDDLAATLLLRTYLEREERAG